MRKICKIEKILLSIFVASSIVGTNASSANNITLGENKQVIQTTQANVITTGQYVEQGYIKTASPMLINNENNNINGDLDVNINNNQQGSLVQSGGSLSKAEDYVGRKLFDIVGFFQVCIKPLTYITFIISGIAILFGIITNSKSKFAGILGMIFSVFVYVAVVFAPQIVEYLGAWLSV